MSESSTLFVATVSYDVMPRPQGALSNGVIRLSVCRFHAPSSNGAF